MRWIVRVVAAGMALIGVVRAETARESLVPAGATRVLRVEAAGVQLYDCAGLEGVATWRFREPLATLMVDGKTVGRHFAGPGWEMTDGSRVRGEVVEEAAGESAGDVPWLRLAVVERSGHGVLGAVTAVARVETHGGVFEGACATVGALHLEPYSAAYLFWVR